MDVLIPQTKKTPTAKLVDVFLCEQSYSPHRCVKRIIHSVSRTSTADCRL